MAELNLSRYWVEPQQELNATLSGRFRESGFVNGQLAVNNIDDAADYYIRDHDKYLSEFDKYRVATYRIHKLLYLGDYYDVFKYFKTALVENTLDDRSGGYFRNTKKQILYVSLNMLGLAARKLADLVSVETPEITPWKEAQPKVDDAIKRIEDNSNFSTLLYNSTLTSGVKGDAVWIVEACRNNPGDMSEKLKVKIRRVRPEIWYPELDGTDQFRIAHNTFAWRYKAASMNSSGGAQYILRRKTYIAGGIVEEANWLTGDTLGDRLTPQQFEKETGEVLPESKLFNQVTVPLVAHLPNLQFDESSPFGLSDYVDIKPVADEMAHRFSQLAGELDKHANLSMAGPRLGANDSPGAGRYFDVASDENHLPQYIQLPTAALDAMMKEIEHLIKYTFVLMEVSPGLVGLKEGAAPQKAEALRLESTNSVMKSQRKQLYMTRGIQDAFQAAMQLENELGIESYNVDGVVGVKWKDGLPDTPTEKAMLAQIRTGGKPTWAVEDAVKYQDGDAADDVLEHLAEETDSSVIDMDESFNMFGQPENGAVNGPPEEKESEEI